MAICIYCGDRVGIVCDSCAGTAQERDEWRKRCYVFEAERDRLAEEVARLRSALSDMPDVTLLFRSAEDRDKWDAWKGSIFNPDGTIMEASNGTTRNPSE